MKKILGLYLVGTLVFIIWATLSSGIENIIIDHDISSFIAKGKLVEEYSTPTSKYYLVEPQEELDQKCYTTNGSSFFPGGPGDIICSREAAITTPIIYEGISYYIGGHASISAFPYSDRGFVSTINDGIEVTGFGSRTYVTKEPKTQWNVIYKEYMAYRVDTSLENRMSAFNKAISFLGEPYNFSFMFELDSKKYCSDLISRSFEYVGIDLNQDMVATTVNDIMASNHTYLCYYSNVIDGIRHTYILGDSLELL